MNKLLPLLAFSVLLLVPVSQNAFADHLSIPTETVNYCEAPFAFILSVPTDMIIDSRCNPLLETSNPGEECAGGPEFNIRNACLPNAYFPDIVQTMCQDNAILDASGHCVPDFDAICTGGSVQSGITCIAQAMNNMIGGVLLETNTIPLLVGAIGVNPVITGLVGITLAGIVGQTAWFVHRRRKAERT